MDAKVSAKGFTNVFLVVNMKQFVREEDQARFERIRGKDEFAKVLREIWPHQLANQEQFITIQEDRRRRGYPEVMSTEQVGFATGVFRSLMLEKFSFPSYALDKDKAQFSDDLKATFQFRSLFLRVWHRWSIYIRPTAAGFFVIRLTNRHLEQSRPFIKITQDLLRLQESLDVQSAQNWLIAMREKFIDEPEKMAMKERYVKAFLEWLGADENYSGGVLYYPVQWRLAMEVCSRFVNAIGSKIDVDGEEKPILLEVPKPSLSISFQDAYTVFHFVELLANSDVVYRSRQGNANTNSQISIGVNDIRQSPQIRQAFINLAEGAILRTGIAINPMETEDERTSSYPKHRWGIVDEILNQNQAPWNDEICLLSSKTAIIMASPKWREHELLISTLPGSTLRVKYVNRWNAVNRAIEFVIEIVSFVNEIENLSYSLLTSISNAFDESFSGDKKHVPSKFLISKLISSSIHLRRLSGLCQEMTNPRVWSQSEIWISLFSNLFSQFNISTSLSNIDSNLDSLSDYLDLYLAQMAERESRKIDLRSIALAAGSLTLTLLMLPSFLADLRIVYNNQINSSYNIFAAFGILLSLVLFVVAIYTVIRSGKAKD